jgi:hypothetical protein
MKPEKKPLFFLSVSLLLLVALFETAAYGQNLDLDGKSYMVFFPVDNNGNPDPDGEVLFPLFVVFGQYEDALWGTMTGVDEDALLNNFVLSLDSARITDGEVKGKKLTAYYQDRLAGQDIRVPVNGKELKDGSILAKMTLMGAKFEMKMYPVNIGVGSQENPRALGPNGTDAYVSGIYLGNVQASGFHSTSKANVLLGAMILGDRIDILMFWQTAAGYLYMALLQGTFDASSGEFTAQGFSPDGAMSMQGSISNGVMDYSTEIFGNSVEDKLYNFGETTMRAPTLKKVKPTAVQKGKTVKLTVKHKYALPGSIVRLFYGAFSPPGVSAEVYINEFTVGKKAIEIMLTTANTASAEVTFEVMNPSGKSTLTKSVSIK